MRVFLVKLRGLAGELRDGGHRVVARECREVDGRVAEFVNFRVVVALPGGLADVGYLFLHAFRAPCRGVFLQVIGVFHGIAVFDKIRKIIRSPPLSGRIYFLFRRPLRASLLSGTASGILFRRGRAVSGAFRNGICGRLRSRLCESCRTWRPGDTSGIVSEWPREIMSGTARSISVSAGVCFCVTACLRTLPSPLISVCFCVWGSPRTAVPLLCIPAAIPFLWRSLFSFVCASLQNESPDREGPGSFAAEILRLFRIISSVPSGSRPWRPSWPARDSST